MSDPDLDSRVLACTGMFPLIYLFHLHEDASSISTLPSCEGYCLSSWLMTDCFDSVAVSILAQGEMNGNKSAIAFFSADTIDLDCLGVLEGHTRSVFCLDPLFDTSTRGFCTNTIASGSGDHTVRLWNLSTGSTLRTLEGHSDDVMCLSFLPHRDWLCSGSRDSTLRLWDVERGTNLTTRRLSFDGCIRDLCYGTPDFPFLFSCCEERRFQIMSLHGSSIRIVHSVQTDAIIHTFCQDPSNPHLLYLGDEFGFISSRDLRRPERIHDELRAQTPGLTSVITSIVPLDRQLFASCGFVDPRRGGVATWTDIHIWSNNGTNLKLETKYYSNPQQPHLRVMGRVSDMSTLLDSDKVVAMRLLDAEDVEERFWFGLELCWLFFELENESLNLNLNLIQICIVSNAKWEKIVKIGIGKWILI